MKQLAIASACAIALAASGAFAQTTAPAAAPAGRSSLGGLAGMLGGSLPGVSSATAGNAAGVLGYCVRNNLLSGTGAASVLGDLTGRQGVATSPDYAAGQSGQLRTGDGTLSLAGLKGRARTKMCDLVLKHARSFL